MKYFNFLAALSLFIIYSLGSIPPSGRFNLWLISFAIPFALAFNIVLLLAGVLLRKRSSVFLLLALLWGGNYFVSTIGIRSFFRNNDPEGTSFSVLNYNLSAFNTGGGDGGDENAESRRARMTEWVMGAPADIKCFQEFPHHPDRDGIDLLKAFRDGGSDHYYSASTNRWDSSRFGTLIVSRFPIIRSGDIMASSNKYNRITYADVAIGPDTIRIINVHLQSMQIRDFHPGYAESMEDGTRKMRVVLQKLKSGVFERSKQIRQLIRFVDESPYAVVCAGDFNELPYSYSYQLLRKHLNNSFEMAGRGFGFTYNGNTLGMLRIDNQFYSSPLKPVTLHTLDTVGYTDHFPIWGTYAIP